MKIRFGTRGSKLALFQTQGIINRIKSRFPDLVSEEIVIKTLGDRVTDMPLFQVGGQGLFIKEIEEALHDGRIDIAVHSLKDVPNHLGAGLILGALSSREDPRDALISLSGLPFDRLPPGARIGTSSLRRRAQLAALRPDLTFLDMRGNLDTRLRKLEEGQADALILAAAGLTRLDLQGRITEFFAIDRLVPAVGQGILGLECRARDLPSLAPFLEVIEDPDATAAANAERTFLRRLQGGCQVPLAAHAVVVADTLSISAFLADPGGKKVARAEVSGPRRQADFLGEQAAERLLEHGAADILQEWRESVAALAPTASPPLNSFNSQISLDSAVNNGETPVLATPRPHSHRGRVFLVGAGPGDPGLITVRGLQLVRAAEVIVHDALGAVSFLDEASPQAELIDAGKRSGCHTLSQDEINAVLIRKGQEGKMVVRLKGGDPMVFGRGGEEAEALKKAGIPFEVIPGVTSAIAGPTYAGIPITHRGFTSEFAVVTGHEADTRSGNESGPPWKSLAGLRSLVFLMGVKQLPEISRHLMEAGMPPETPVALIEQATTPTQRTILGTLRTIAEIAATARITPPAIILIGQVASLRDQCSWFEKRPLFGRSIIVTRSRHQAAEFCRNLETLGARVFPFPTIRVEPLPFDTAFAPVLKHLNDIRHLVFSSVNGAELFCAHLRTAGLDGRALSGKRIICIGSVTADRFREKGLIPDFVPARFVAEEMLPAFSGTPTGEVAILGAEQSRDALAPLLSERGWKIHHLPLYRTRKEDNPNPAALEELRLGKIDAVTFSSSSTVDGFMEFISRENIVPSTIPAIAIGPITEKTVRENGLNLIGSAPVHTIPGLTAKIMEIFAA
jgi:uroporphyrinogen III methyltransferase/synthase